MTNNKFSYGSDKLTPYEAIKIAKGKKLAIISDEQAKKINASRDIIENLSKSIIDQISKSFEALIRQ